MTSTTGPIGPQENDRRDFLKYVLGGGLIAWLAAVLYPVFAYMKPPKQGEVEVTSVKAGKVDELRETLNKFAVTMLKDEDLPAYGRS